MIILDLEWNSGCSEERLEEILQIGAVKVDRLGGPITDTFCIYIRPKFHKEFCLNARMLPELNRSRRSKTCFPEAVRAFKAWCGEEQEFAAWGGGDFKVLRQNAERWEIKVDFPEDTLNLQNAFSHTLMAGRQIALYKAVAYCGIPDSFTFHNALHDAVYTAMVARYISPEGVELARGQGTKAKGVGINGQKGWTGPFASWEEALNHPANRHPTCLRCGKAGGVGQWFYLHYRRCYCVFRCAEHGSFLCTLYLKKDHGKWWASLHLSPMTRERKKEYLAAKHARVFDCTPAKRKRRRPAKRSGEAAP